jgi:hypothetical protein
MEDIGSWILQVHNNLSFESLISSSSTSSKVSEDSSDTDVESWASIGEANFADTKSNSDDAEALDIKLQDVVSASISGAEAELYNSGASCHISLFQHHFVTYQPITP